LICACDEEDDFIVLGGTTLVVEVLFKLDSGPVGKIPLDAEGADDPADVDACIELVFKDKVVVMS